MNQIRDLYGQWAATNAGNAGGGSAADPRAADWGNTRDALMKHDTARPGSPASLPGPGFVPQVPDFASAFRAMGYTDGDGEGPGTHQVKTPEGPASQGKDVPGTGVPGPVEGAEAGAAGAGEAAAGAGEAAAGGAAAGEGAAGLVEGALALAPIALAPIGL